MGIVWHACCCYNSRMSYHLGSYPHTPVKELQVIKYTILCTYPSGQQRLVSTYLEDDKDNIPEEFVECLQGCNPHNYYEVVGVEILKDSNARQLSVQQTIPVGVL